MSACRSRHQIDYQIEALEYRLLMAVLPVLNTNASGAGSLRDVIASAGTGDTVDLFGVHGTIDLASAGPISINTDFLIAGRDDVTLINSSTGRVFSMNGGALSLRRVVFAGGVARGDSLISGSGSLVLDWVVMSGNNAASAGAAINLAGSLTATNTIFMNNTGDFEGGAVRVTGGNVTLKACAFAYNTAAHLQGDAGVGGALALVDPLAVSLTNCTFSNNRAVGLSMASGGAIEVAGGTASSSFTLLNCTIADNAAVFPDTIPNGVTPTGAYGGGIFFNFFHGTTSIINTIVAGNTASVGAPDLFSANSSAVGGHHNLIGNGDPGPGAATFTNTNHNQVGSSANVLPSGLGPLLHTGSTYVRPVLPYTGVGLTGLASGAADPASAPLVDQRSYLRDQNPEIGAYEAENPVAGYGAVLELYGSGGRVTIPHNVALQPAQNLTIAAWMELDPPATGMNTIFSYGDPNTSMSYVLGYAVDAGEFRFQAGNTAVTFSIPADQLTGAWHKVTALYRSGTASLVLDGQVVASATNGSSSISYSSVATGMIGGWVGASDSYFRGKLDEVRIWNSAINPTRWDVENDLLTSSAAAHWNFDGSMSSTIHDSGSAHADGTIAGQALLSNYDVPTPQMTIVEDTPGGAAEFGYDFDGGVFDFSIASQGTQGTVSISPTTGMVTYIPNADAFGSDSFTYRIHTLNGYSRPVTVNVTILGTQDPPQFTSTAPTSASQQSLYGYSISASDPDDDPLSYTATDLPAWLTLSDNGLGVATLSGTPGSAGDFPVTLHVSDGTATVDQSFTIHVASNHAPTFTSTAGTLAFAGTTYNYNIATTDADGDTLNITAPTKPAWLTLTDNGNGTATLSGTPANGDAGSANVKLRVSDGMTFTDQSFSISVIPVAHPPVFANVPDPTTAEALLPFAHTFTATDADGNNLSFSLTGAPGWLSLVDHGDGSVSISGTPQTIDMGTTTAVSITVNDGTGPVTKLFYLTVPAWRFRLDDNGTLAVVGTNDADQLSVTASGSFMRVNHNGALKNFPLASVKSVEVYGQDGNDLVTLDTAGVSTYALGGAGKDTLVGGDQPDNLVGGGGNDRLEGNGGDDRLSGLDGNDYILGGGGKDRIYGGNGSDYIVGGTGADRIWGEAGSDFILAKDKYPDQLYADSASSTDAAQVDALDTLSGLFDTFA